MKIITTIMAILALALIAGCDSGSDSTGSSDSSDPELTAEQVEGYFAAKRTDKANRISQDSNGLVSVEDESCTIESPGKATCIEKIHYESGLSEVNDTYVWNVEYTADGDILSYTKK